MKNPRPSWAVAASTVRATASLDSRNDFPSSTGELMAWSSHTQLWSTFRSSDKTATRAAHFVESFYPFLKNIILRETSGLDETVIAQKYGRQERLVRGRIDIERGGGEIGKRASIEAHLKRGCLRPSMQVPIFPIRRHRKNRRPLKTGFIHGGGAEGTDGKPLFFLSVNRRLFPLLGKDQVFPAGVMPDHPLMKKECSRKYQNRRNHGGRYSLRQNS